MPEQDRKDRILEGEIEITPSSDEAIQATIARLENELRGIPEPGIVIEGEPLKPLSLPGVKLPHEIEEETKILDISAKLTANDSRLGLEISRSRSTKKLEKAA